MRALELFVSRPPEQEAKLHLMELKTELSLPSGAREQEVREKFFDFIDRATARFEFSTSKYLSAAEADLPRMWVQFKGHLLGIEEGPGSLFPPAIRNTSGTARSDLAQLFGAHTRCGAQRGCISLGFGGACADRGKVELGLAMLSGQSCDSGRPDAKGKTSEKE